MKPKKVNNNKTSEIKPITVKYRVEWRDDLEKLRLANKLGTGSNKYKPFFENSKFMMGTGKRPSNSSNYKLSKVVDNFFKQIHYWKQFINHEKSAGYRTEKGFSLKGITTLFMALIFFPIVYGFIPSVNRPKLEAFKDCCNCGPVGQYCSKVIFGLQDENPVQHARKKIQKRKQRT